MQFATLVGRGEFDRTRRLVFENPWRGVLGGLAGARNEPWGAIIPGIALGQGDPADELLWGMDWVRSSI